MCLGIMTLATVSIVGMFGLLSLGASLTPETEPLRLAIAFLLFQPIVGEMAEQF